MELLTERLRLLVDHLRTHGAAIAVHNKSIGIVISKAFVGVVLTINW